MACGSSLADRLFLHTADDCQLRADNAETVSEAVRPGPQDRHQGEGSAPKRGSVVPVGRVVRAACVTTPPVLISGRDVRLRRVANVSKRA